MELQAIKKQYEVALEQIEQKANNPFARKKAIDYQKGLVYIKYQNQLNSFENKEDLNVEDLFQKFKNEFKSSNVELTLMEFEFLTVLNDKIKNTANGEELEFLLKFKNQEDIYWRLQKNDSQKESWLSYVEKNFQKEQEHILFNLQIKKKFEEEWVKHNNKPEVKRNSW